MAAGMAALVDVSGISRKFQGAEPITEAPCGMTVLMECHVNGNNCVKKDA